MMPLCRTLDNGLKVLVRETHTVPVVSAWVWYRVGARNEHGGITGISHWVEHMLFRGTERWPAGAADRAIARFGGTYNGLTWYDFTTFYETLPSDKLALALDIESDRMQHAQFDAEAVESERAVIISERQSSENSPLFLLSEEVSGAAYRVHPYGHATIGHRCDLEAMTRQELQRHYATYYVPNNAIVAIAGDVVAEATVEAVAQTFGSLERSADPPAVRAIEPAQRGERRVVVQGAGNTDYIEIAYHVPAATHPDFHALTVLNAILSGGSGFLVGEGYLTNHTSRLYRALVEEEYAVDINGMLAPTIDPGLYRLAATVWPGRKPEEVLQRMEEEVVHLCEAAVTDEELAKARRQARALFAYSSESISNQAFWLGFCEIFADQSWFDGYLENLAQVTAQDVQRVAQDYLTPRNRTVGWYLGEDKGISGL